MQDHGLYAVAERLYHDHETDMLALEKKRRGHIVFTLITSLVAAAIAGPLLWFFIPIYMRLEEPPVDLWPVVALVGIICLTTLYPIFDRDYRNKAKRDFLPLMAKAGGLQYRRGGVMRLGDLYDHHILPPYAGREIEEGFKGRYKDFDLEFQDFKISPVRDGLFFDWRSFAASSHLRGVVIRIGLNKTLQYHTVLMPRFMANGFLKRHLHDKFIFHKDVRFVYRKLMRSYTILATHNLEAHYVLDPAVVERVMAVGELLEAQWLEMSFKDREMVIYAQYTQNFFELGGMMEPVSPLTIERCLTQIKSLRSVVDTMELTPYAGLGGSVPLNENRNW